MKIIKSIAEMQLTMAQLVGNQQLDAGLVPTMGYLHPGHLSLIAEAKKHCQIVIVSIFVNPLQFGPKEDFNHYPRDLEHDCDLCKNAGVDIVFVPEASEIIITPTMIKVNVEQLDQHLCGSRRPGHFQGVCTIVSKLFNIIQPKFAFFGKKDIQQLTIIKRMTAELNFPVKIIEVETVRDVDGLALSSRNKYLNAQERIAAIIVPNTVKFITQKILEGMLKREQILNQAQLRIANETLAKIDYLEIVTKESLQPTADFTQEIIVAVAIYIGNTRLIDNHLL